MAAYYSAVRAGVSALEFWGMTPYLTRQAVIALSDGMTVLAWSIGGMTRAKKLPHLDTLLIRSEPKEAPAPETLETKMKTLFKTINEKKGRK